MPHPSTRRGGGPPAAGDGDGAERRPGRTLPFTLVAAIFVADQASKLWVLYGLDLAAGPRRVLPGFELALVWNRGISYGLFQQSGIGRWLLVAFTFAAVVGLGIWLWRARSLRLQLALAILVGGALGNLADRIAYGAVVDFVHLYWRDFSWYVFNVSDSAIVIGVLLLLVDSFMPGGPSRSEGRETRT